MFAGVRDAFENTRNAFENTIHDVTDRFGQNRRRRGRTRPQGPNRAEQQSQGPHRTEQRRPSPPPATRRAPPASLKAVRKLPMIRVSPEDLIDPNNRECCICLEDNKLDEIVIRLPCAHIFHKSCIVDWLVNHMCTCPVCRYELPTDDPSYEAGRKERMKLRKPRYAMHELKRMPVSGLLELLRRPLSGVFEKNDLIQDLIKENWIVIIPSPEPVEYELEVLKRMKIRELKKAMENAGVFFRREDVVEKSDMITVFENSGRLLLVESKPEDGDVPIEDKTSLDETEAPDPTSTEARTSQQSEPEESEIATDDGTKSVDPSPSDAALSQKSVEREKRKTPDDGESAFGDGTTPWDASEASGSSPSGGTEPQSEDDPMIVETIPNDDVSRTEDIPGANETMDENRTASPIVMFPNLNHRMDKESGESLLSTDAIQTTLGSPTSENSTGREADALPTDSDMQHSVEEEFPTQRNSETQSTPVDMEISGLEENRTGSVGGSCVQMETDKCDPTLEATIDSVDRGTDLRRSFDHYTITDLHTLAKDLQADLSNCIVREDMVDVFVNAGITGNPDASALMPRMFSSYSVSQLRFIGSKIDIDLSQCSTGEEMIEKIVQVGNVERPYLRDYLRSLAPLTTMSLSNLRAVARELRINISDCLEKDEIIQLLASRRN